MQYTWTCRSAVNALSCTTFWKPCVIIMLPCEISKQASSTASLPSWLNSPGTGQRRSAQIATANPNLSPLPSYKSRRSFGLSSVFPSVSRHVGPNPDVEIIRADAAAEFRESRVPLSGSSVKPHRITKRTSCPVNSKYIARRTNYQITVIINVYMLHIYSRFESFIKHEYFVLLAFSPFY